MNRARIPSGSRSYTTGRFEIISLVVPAATDFFSRVFSVFFTRILTVFIGTKRRITPHNIYLVVKRTQVCGAAIVLLAAVSGGVPGPRATAVYFPVRFRLLVSRKSNNPTPPTVFISDERRRNNDKSHKFFAKTE